MTSDDQQFLDVLAGISKDIRNFTGNIADATDRHFEQVASSIKDKLSSATWLPEAARPSRPSVPLAVFSPSAGYLERLQDWVSRNRALTAAVAAFFATGGFLVYRMKRDYVRKRRVRRAKNGARTEVAVIAGSPNSPITKSIALDLDRRGFIVYITTATLEEEQQIQNEGRVDVRPLHIDVVDTLSLQQAMERFNNIILSPHQAFPGATPHNLHFAGLVLVPDLIYPSGPIETVSAELWSDALNAKVLNTIAVTQAFLPSICEFKGRVLLLIPSIVSSLRPPFHSVESAVVGALEGFVTSLGAELGTLGIEVCHLKLGTFDFSTSPGSKHHLTPISAHRTYAWSPSTRALYAQNYVAQNRGLFADTGSAAKGSSLRTLNNAVFDALTEKHPKRVWRVGRGSVAYDLVGNWVPRGIVGWILGIRRVSLDEISEPQLLDSVQSWEKVEAGG